MFRALIGITLVFTVTAASAAGSLQFSCTGDMIEPAGLARSPKTLKAIFSPATKVSKVSSHFGKGAINAPVTSNNLIQPQVPHQGFRRRVFLLRSRYVSHRQIRTSCPTYLCAELNCR